MLSLLARHSFAAILLAVVIEELGLPMPVPTDIMIVFAGTAAASSVPHLVLFFVTLTLASAVGGSGLYAIVRRGGRPLVERFGHYVHLRPEQLARFEALLERGGWGTIALGRAIPGLRYATVIACGLLKVPFPRYVTAHIVGSSVYIAVFLALGAIFGPSILDRIHLPAHAARLLWLLLLALGLPLLIVQWGRHVHSRHSTAPSRRRLFGSVLLGGFAGAVALTATLSTSATVAELLLGASRPLNVAYFLMGWTILGLELDAGVAVLVLYVLLLSLLIGAAALYYELVLPYLVPGGIPPLWQVLGLALLVLGFFGIIFLFSLLVEAPGSLGLWWRTGGPIMLLGATMGVTAYAVTVVYGRILAIAATTTFRRDA